MAGALVGRSAQARVTVSGHSRFARSGEPLYRDGDFSDAAIIAVLILDGLACAGRRSPMYALFCTLISCASLVRAKRRRRGRS